MGSTAIVLAAGKGTRMKSELPKVLHVLAGRPLVAHVVLAAQAAGVDGMVVVLGHGAQQVEAAVRAVARVPVDFAVQAEQRGTGHAVLCALSALGPRTGPVLILSGDVPGLESRTLVALTVACERTSGGLSFLVFRPGDPSGYGRVLRDADGRVTRIREHRDASPEELRVDLCNAGVYCVRAEHLHRELPRLQAANAQGEIYLTDLVERVAVHGEVEALEVDAREVAGVNTPEQLEALERARARPD